MSSARGFFGYSVEEYDAGEDAERERQEADIMTRTRLARIIHDAWCVEPYDPTKHPEDLAAAEAVIAAFPKILEG